MTYRRFAAMNPSFVRRNGKDAFKAYCYSLYQMDWLTSHGIALDDALVSLAAHAMEYDDEAAETVVNEWTGYNGMVYASFYEFLESEYKMDAYMRELLNDEDYAAYVADVQNKGRMD